MRIKTTSELRDEQRAASPAPMRDLLSEVVHHAMKSFLVHLRQRFHGHAMRVFRARPDEQVLDSFFFGMDMAKENFAADPTILDRSMELLAKRIPESTCLFLEMNKLMPDNRLGPTLPERFAMDTTTGVMLRVVDLGTTYHFETAGMTAAFWSTSVEGMHHAG